MIKTWKTSATRQLAETGKSKFSGLDVNKALERLMLLNAAVTLKQITPLKSVGLHALKGDRKGLWAMTINGSWRLCFRFKDSDAYDVEIVDYH